MTLQARGSPIVFAAQLEAAGGAHRALLFKFLADASNVPCSLVGRQSKGALQARPEAWLLCTRPPVLPPRHQYANLPVKYVEGVE